MEGCECIYGINLNGKITPNMVRDAIVECYYQADLKVLEDLFYTSDFKSDEDEEGAKRKHVEVVIKKLFDDVNGDFNNPTKKSLIAVIDKCKEFAKYFRDQSVIQKHYTEILTLINKIE